MKFRPLALAAACAATALTIAPAIAQAADSVTIKYKDLDLSTKRGLEELEQRTERAAAEACGLNTVTTGTILRSSTAKECYNEVLVKLRQQTAQIVKRETRG